MNAVPELSPWKALVLCLFAAAAAAFLLLETVYAQEGPEYSYVDLVMLYEQLRTGPVRYTVKNNGTATAIGVTVSFLLEDLETDEEDLREHHIITDYGTVGNTKQRFTWVVGDIPPGGASGALSFSTKLHPGRHSEVQPGYRGRIGVINATASSLSPEPEMLLSNNSVKVYSFVRGSVSRTLHMGGNRLALLLSVDDLRPDAGGAVNFGLTADNENSGEAAVSAFISLIGDIDIRLTLSDGLQFKTGWGPSGVTVASDRQSATWKPEATDTRGDVRGPATTRPQTREIQIQAQLTSDTLADIPLEERCITAWVEDSTPPPSPDYALGSLKQCLGDDPPVLFEQGTLQAFTPYPCVDASGTAITSYPCDASDSTSEIAVIAVADSYGQSTDPRLQGVGRSGGGPHPKVTLLPDQGRITVQVKDPSARVVSNGAVTWQTGREAAVGPETVPGVIVTYSVKDFVDTTSGKECPGTTTCRWSNLARTIKVKGLTQDVPPGGVKIKINNMDEFQHHDANSGNSYTHIRPTWRLGQYVANRSTIYFLEFTTLGTYVIDYTAGVTRRSDSAVQEDTGSYTFHVGPVAELEVRDAGPNPAIAPGQRAYTITAINNGPDAAPVEVLLTPWRIPAPSITHAIPSEGSYRDGVWTIEELESAENRRASGQSEGPTLTVIADSDVPFWADIAAVGEYAVCIGSDGRDIAAVHQTDCEANSGASWHSANYYDYLPGNNRADIMPWPGTGEGAPGAPRGLTVVATALGNILQWQPVARVNGYGVTHYEVWSLRQDWWHEADVTGTIYRHESFGDDLPEYRIRAVNLGGVAGPWSSLTPGLEGVRARPPAPVQPPDPVTGLTAKAGDGYVDLEWRAGSHGGREIIWQLWRADEETWWDVFPRVVGSSKRGYTVTGLENGREYVFRVRAATPTEHGELVPGVSSGPVLATPAAPQVQQSPPEETPGQTPPPGENQGPNHPPEFDRDAAWYPETPWCASAGAGLRHGGGPGQRLGPGRRPARLLPSHRL